MSPLGIQFWLHLVIYAPRRLDLDLRSSTRKLRLQLCFFFWLFLKSLPLIQVTGKVSGWLQSFVGWPLGLGSQDGK